MSRAAGEYQEQLSKYSGGTFRPEEIKDLQSVCGTSGYSGKASTIITAPWLYDDPLTAHPFVLGMD